MNESPFSMKTEIIELLENNQVWELTDRQLVAVKTELLRMNSKIHNEQALRHMSDFPDTPLAEMYGG